MKHPLSPDVEFSLLAQTCSVTLKLYIKFIWQRKQLGISVVSSVSGVAKSHMPLSLPPPPWYSSQLSFRLPCHTREGKCYSPPLPPFKGYWTQPLLGGLQLYLTLQSFPWMLHYHLYYELLCSLG